MNDTLAKLQDSIAKKDAKLDAGAEEKLAALEDLLIREKDLDEDARNAVLAALKKNLETRQKHKFEAIQKEQQKQKLLFLKKQAGQEMRSANEQQRKKAALQREEARALAAAARASREAALARHQELLQQKQLIEKSTSKNKSIEGFYSTFKKQQEKLEAEESEIEAMRREIRELRNELQKIKKSGK